MTDQGAARASAWPLEGYFQCAGNDLFVKTNCLGETFASATAIRPITVTLPQLDAPEPNAVLARPAWKFPHPDRSADLEPKAEGKWGAVGSMTDKGIGEEFPTYAAVRGCLIYADIETTDEESFRTNVSAFAHELDLWWTALTDWLGVVSVQDFVGLGRRPRSILEHGVNAWTKDDTGHRRTACGKVEYVVPGEPDKLTKDQLQRCMRLALKSNRPPIEWRLIADARSLSKAREHRRAVLEAGTAAEPALTALLEHEVPSAELERITLGGLKDLARQRIPHRVPLLMKEELVRPRNDAIHRAKQDTSRDTAQKAIAKAAEVVQQAYPLV